LLLFSVFFNHPDSYRDGSFFYGEIEVLPKLSYLFFDYKSRGLSRSDCIYLLPLIFRINACRYFFDRFSFHIFLNKGVTLSIPLLIRGCNIITYMKLLKLVLIQISRMDIFNLPLFGKYVFFCCFTRALYKLLREYYITKFKLLY